MLASSGVYFPLVEEDLSSDQPGYKGTATNVRWVPDPVFGNVLECDEARQSRVSLPGVTYGQEGPFSVVFWVRTRVEPGKAFDYAYSHGYKTGSNGSSANLVSLYFPQQEHPDYGVMRAMARDANDVAGQAGAQPFYLDTNGCVANPKCEAPTNMSLVANDATWHMVGLTTHPDGGKGFEIYVDGEQVSSVDSNTIYRDANGNRLAVTGGDPLELEGDIVLCGRNDLDPSRFFSGNIAHLMIFNESLTAEQMQDIWLVGMSAASVAFEPGELPLDQAPLALPLRVPSENGTLTSDGAPPEPAFDCVTQCSIFYGDYMCRTSDGELRLCQHSGSAAGSPAAERGVAPRGFGAVAMIDGQPICSPVPLEGLNTIPACAEGYTCAPLSADKLIAFFPKLNLEPGDAGICVYAPGGMMLPSPLIVPPAMAFFPLSTQTLQSYPLAAYSSVSSQASIAPDPLFGSVLECNQQDFDMVALDPVPYAADGSFSVNLWVKPGNMSGDGLGYLFSHRSTDANTTGTSGFGPNQIQILMPEEDHPSYGVVRAYVKDSLDPVTATPNAMVYLDSDGSVGYNGPRKGTKESPFADGQWHMVTLTSQPDGSKGYRLYVDGALVNELSANTTTYTGDGYLAQVDGGDPIDLTGEEVLCSRSDDTFQRHFDGELAYLGLYDYALIPEQVQALYDTVQERVPFSQFDANTAQQVVPVANIKEAGATVERVSTTGKQCQFPALYNGHLYNDCVDISGKPYCKVDRGDEGVWEPCVEDAIGPAGAAAGLRYTISGQPCVFPAEFQGQAITDCIDVMGRSMCQTASGFWQQCVPGSEADYPSSPLILGRGHIYAANGMQCADPLLYQGQLIESCISVAGDYMCWTVEGQNWEVCSDASLAARPSPGTYGIDPAAVPVPAVPVRARTTADGDSCMLPTVYQGEIIDECVPINGTMSCLAVRGGGWKECVEPAEGFYYGEQAELMVATRKTVAGEECRLPAVYDGYLWFDCIPQSPPAGSDTPQTGSGGAQVGICPTRDGLWKECAPGVESPDATVKFSPAVALDRTVPGDLGMLCAVLPDEKLPNIGCDPKFLCVPLPTWGGELALALSGLGFCANRPAGTSFGVLGYLQASGIVPMAYFPLSGEELGSITLPALNGTSVGELAWVDDDKFARVPNCEKDNGNSIILDSVPYGTDGSFAINLWMRRQPDSAFSGKVFQYLYSHTSGDAASPMSPNQVSIYLADKDHPAYGYVRAFVKDSNDVTSELSFLDSDGQVNSNEPRAGLPEHGDVNDGAWHMITLSTFANGTEGYRLYVDGRTAGTMRPSSIQPSGSLVVPTAGDSALMTEDIYLCSRSDRQAERFYDGALAHLMIFDEPLSPSQVAGMYSQYMSDTGAPGSTNSSAAGVPGMFGNVYGASLNSGDPSSSSDSGLSGGAIAGIVIGTLVGVSALVALGALALRSRRKGGSGASFERYQEDPFSASRAEAGAASAVAGGADGTAFIQMSSSGKAPPPSGVAPPASLPTQGSGDGFSVQPAVERDAASVASSAQDVSIATGSRNALGVKQAARVYVQGP